MGDLTVVPSQHIKAIRASKRNEDKTPTVNEDKKHPDTKTKLFQLILVLFCLIQIKRDILYILLKTKVRISGVRLVYEISKD